MSATYFFQPPHPAIREKIVFLHILYISRHKHGRTTALRMEAQAVSAESAHYHHRAAGRGDRPRAAQCQCRPRLLQRQDTHRRHPVGGQRGDTRPCRRLVQPWAPSRRALRQRRPARGAYSRCRGAHCQRPMSTDTAVRRAAGHTRALQRAGPCRPIPAMLPGNTLAEPAHRTQLDQCPAGRTLRNEEPGHRRPSEALRRLMGVCLLCYAGAQLWLTACPSIKWTTTATTSSR